MADEQSVHLWRPPHETVCTGEFMPILDQGCTREIEEVTCPECLRVYNRIADGITIVRGH